MIDRDELLWFPAMLCCVVSTSPALSNQVRPLALRARPPAPPLLQNADIDAACRGVEAEVAAMRAALPLDATAQQQGGGGGGGEGEGAQANGEAEGMQD